jgi:hypothetical protein
VLGTFFALSTLIVGLSGGCAKGTEPPGSTTGSGASGAGAGTSSGGSGGGTGGGPVGGPCQTAQDCPDGGECVQIGGQKICTLACPPECPSGSYCTLIEGDPFCVPETDSQCGQCLGSAQCKGVTDECLTAPQGDKFCARDCTVMDDCPSGYVCTERADYLALGVTPGSGGGGGAGGAGGAGVGGPSLPDGGTAAPPSGGAAQVLRARGGRVVRVRREARQRHEELRPEERARALPGFETCDGESATWVGCTSKTPAAETCNMADDDCDDAVDEDDPNAMCGGKPPNGQWGCNAGACTLAGCDPGWTHYPPGMASNGCTCPADASEPNDSCATPASAGQVLDTGGPVEISGTLSSDTDVDVWAFDAVDVDEGTTNSYHVSIDLQGGEAIDTVLIDVIRGDACSDAPGGAAVGITSYDWCVDGKSADGTAGEAPCAPTGPVHCNDNSAKYFVRVYRKAGAPAACTPYKVQVSAKGGDPCDFTKQCQ